MNINELSRMMEGYANSSDLGEIDFIFPFHGIIRHNVNKINNDRLVIISCGLLDGNFETVGTVIYEQELLDDNCKFVGIEELFSFGVQKAVDSYAYTAMHYTDIIKDLLVSSICSDKVWEAYKNGDIQILTELNNGNIDFPKPTIVNKKNNDIVNNNILRKEQISESTQDLNEACTMLLEYISDIESFNEISFFAKTLMITDDIYWQELKITKAFIFGELHLVFGRRNCAIPNQYMNAYIVKISEPNGLSDYVDGAIKDIITTCTKVSSNPITFDFNIIRTSEFDN